MGKINWGRVLLGGVVAAIVIDLVDYVVNTYVWERQYAVLMKALGIQLRAHAIPVFLLEGLVFGIVLVWAYAAARPRYGAGAKTALITGFAVWVVGSLIPDVDEWASGILPAHLMCAGVVVGLVTILVASLAGASLYKEA
jgi:hypothetical protein